VAIDAGKQPPVNRVLELPLVYIQADRLPVHIG
jgi:hypothetical protein